MERALGGSELHRILPWNNPRWRPDAGRPVRRSTLTSVAAGVTAHGGAGFRIRDWRAGRWAGGRARWQARRR